MLSSLKNMFKVPDLRNKVLFTLLIISLYQFGANVPVPGISFSAVQQLEQQAKAATRGFLGRLEFCGEGLDQDATLAAGWSHANTVMVCVGVAANRPSCARRCPARPTPTCPAA